MHCETYRNWTILIGTTESGGWMFYYTPPSSADALPGRIEYATKQEAIDAAHELVDYQVGWGGLSRMLEDWLDCGKIDDDEYHAAITLLSTITYLGKS
jgi:hypothetical protein